MRLRPFSPLLWQRSRYSSVRRAPARPGSARAAAARFNEKGFRAIALDGAADRLDMTKPTIYRCIKNNEEKPSPLPLSL
jgi:hypothetical protein